MDKKLSQDWRWRSLEVLWIFLLLFLFVGSPPPDAGESHYLVKAKHYWDRDFCRGDLFLESPEAHLVFCWVFGWLTKFCSLDATAWILRVISWLGFAFAWQRLSWAVAPQRFWSILSAGLMLALLRNCHMSRELILVGGVEAKVFAYMLVLLGMGELVRGRWNWAWAFMGAASAMHVIVGGWAGVALGVAWLLAPKDRPRFIKMLPGLACAFVLALEGLIPGLLLTWGQDKDSVNSAHQIYVFERLPHHLVFHRFGNWYIARHLALVACWGVLAWWNWSKSSRVQGMVLGAVLVAAVGIAIDQGLVAWATVAGTSREDYQSSAAPILRYYFFRLSDALVPMGVSLWVFTLLLQWRESRPALASYGLVAALGIGSLNIVEICVDRSLRPLPGAWIQPHPTPDGRWRAWQLRGEEGHQQLAESRRRFAEWKNLCRWICDNTPAKAKFITPRNQQTFKWYAERAEVVTWKDIPQDAAGLVEWRKTLSEVFPPEGFGSDPAVNSDAEIQAIAKKHGASYLVIDRKRSTRLIGLPRLRPDDEPLHPTYAIYLISPPPAAP
ncbi:MAG: hypothetical protein IAF94_10795 [Pirellulaceae bacterium]|nr:hypothetical protein [Pirellulaceae bacterium]